MSRIYTMLEKSLAEKQLEVKKIEEQMAVFRANYKRPCQCGKTHKIGDLVRLVKYRYQRSYAAYEDDTWDPRPDLYWVCPENAVIMLDDDETAIKWKESFGFKARWYPAGQGYNHKETFTVGWNPDTKEFNDLASLLRHFKKEQDAKRPAPVVPPVKPVRSSGPVRVG